MKRIMILLLTFIAAACNRSETSQPTQTAAPVATAGDPKQLIARYGCTVCHVIPGIEGAQGRLGPSLEGIASRPMISMNTVPNTRENLVKFIQEPASLNPQSSMPPIGLPTGDANTIADYLMTLK